MPTELSQPGLVGGAWGSMKKQRKRQRPRNEESQKTKRSYTPKGKGCLGQDLSPRGCVLLQTSVSTRVPLEGAGALHRWAVPRQGQSTTGWFGPQESPSGRKEGRKHLHRFLNLPRASSPHHIHCIFKYKHLGRNIKCLETSKIGMCTQRGMCEVQDWFCCGNGVDLAVRRLLMNSR